jgi:hypothetical protein
VGNDFLFNQMKKLYPEDSDEEMMAKIEAADAPDSSIDGTPVSSSMPSTKIEGPDTPIVAPANPYKDMAIQNVKEKYGIADRQKIMDENAAATPGNVFGAALASFGAGLAGGDAASAGANALKMQEEIKANKLSAFDKARQASLSERDDLVSQEKLKRETDPSSVESKMAQDLAVQMGMDPEQAKGLTAAKFKDFSPIMEKKYAVAEQTQARKDAADALAESRLQIAHENSLNRADANAKRSEDKRAENDNKDAMKLQQDLDKGWATRGGQGGVIQGKVNSRGSSTSFDRSGQKSTWWFRFPPDRRTRTICSPLTRWNKCRISTSRGFSS